jgi:Flp pilus assembly protein TadG
MVLSQGDTIVKPMRLAGERGQILIITALGMVMLLGVAGLSIDASYMYDKRNKLFAAADAAAKSGALEVYRDVLVSDALIQSYGEQQVTAQLAGFNPGVTTSVSVRRCSNVAATCSAPFAGNNRYVEAVVSEVTSTFFGNILGFANANPGARAVAGISGGPNCVVVFDHVVFSNPAVGSLVTMPNCSMVIGSSTSPTSPAVSEMTNHANIDAQNVGVVHTGNTGCATSGDCFLVDGSLVTYGVTPPGDPLATLPPLADPGGATCTGPLDLTVDTTISVSDINSYYCGIKFHGGILTLNSGNYYINGPLTAQNIGTDVKIRGTGVMLFLSAAGGRVDFNSNFVELGDSVSLVPMTAPTSGVYNGILFYQARTTPVNTTALFGKNLTYFVVEGAFYFPTATIVMNNENSPTLMNPCTLIVAWAIEVDKPHFSLDNGCSAFGGSPLLTVSMAE